MKLSEPILFLAPLASSITLMLRLPPMSGLQQAVAFVVAVVTPFICMSLFGGVCQMLHGRHAPHMHEPDAIGGIAGGPVLGSRAWLALIVALAIAAPAAALFLAGSTWRGVIIAACVWLLLPVVGAFAALRAARREAALRLAPSRRPSLMR